MTKAAAACTGNVLFTLKKNFPVEARNWMQTALQKFNCPFADAQVKQKFLNSFGEHKTKKDFGFVIIEFYQTCRGWNANKTDTIIL